LMIPDNKALWGCVCLLLQYLLQSCSRGGGGGRVEDMCYERLRAEVTYLLFLQEQIKGIIITSLPIAP
jgi:hypothetical protein